MTDLVGRSNVSMLVVATALMNNLVCIRLRAAELLSMFFVEIVKNMLTVYNAPNECMNFQIHYMLSVYAI